MRYVYISKIYFDFLKRIIPHTSLDMNSLEANRKYYFSIAAFNENGVGNYVSYDDKGL